MELIQDISRVFGKWFGGEQLMGDEIEFITFCIIIGVLLIICIILLLCLAYESHLWRSIRWAFSTCLNLQSETVALSCKHQPVRSMVMQSVPKPMVIWGILYLYNLVMVQCKKCNTNLIILCISVIPIPILLRLCNMCDCKNWLLIINSVPLQ